MIAEPEFRLRFESPGGETGCEIWPDCTLESVLERKRAEFVSDPSWGGGASVDVQLALTPDGPALDPKLLLSQLVLAPDASLKVRVVSLVVGSGGAVRVVRIESHESAAQPPGVIYAQPVREMTRAETIGLTSRPPPKAQPVGPLLALAFLVSVGINLAMLAGATPPAPRPPVPSKTPSTAPSQRAESRDASLDAEVQRSLRESQQAMKDTDSQVKRARRAR